MVGKVQLDSFKDKEQFAESPNGTIYDIHQGKLLKVLSDEMIDLHKQNKISFEKRILDERVKNVPEIVNPIESVYDKEECCGFTMAKINGVPLRRYYFNEDKNNCNLTRIAEIYQKIEEVIKKGNKLGIVFPDICSGANILITNDDEVKFIDYDGMQVGPDDKSICYSNYLSKFLYVTDGVIKFYSYDKQYTKELDKVSLVVILFELLFGINIFEKVRYYGNGDIVNIKKIAKMYGLIDDKELIEKLRANISRSQEGIFLQDEVYKLSEKYELYLDKDNLGKTLKRLRAKTR